MAIYSFNAGIVKRSSGQFVTAAAAYRAGERIHDETSGLTHDYSRKHDVDAKFIMLPEGAPDWMRDRTQLWTTVERVEKRCDAQLARKLMFALPVELSPAENQKLVHGFLQENCIDQGMVADVCYHALDSHNPHAHVLLTMRKIDGDHFGTKERAWNDKATLQGWREQWEEHANRMLDRAGVKERIDHRTLKEQGSERIAQIHLGPNVAAMRDKGIDSDRGDLYAEIEERNEELNNLVAQREALEREIAQLEAAYQQEDAADPANPTPSVAVSSAISPSLNHQDVGQEEDAEDIGFAWEEPKAEVTKIDGVTPHPQFSGSSGSGNQAGDIRLTAAVTADPTAAAVQEQLATLGAAHYDVMLTRRRQEDGKMERQTRRWDADEITHSLSWLKRANAQGFDVMIRPEKNQGYVILDGLKRRQIEQLRADGLSPALVLNTHQSHYQAWIQISHEPIPQKEALAAAQIMAQAYQCDAKSWQYGRLAGFTNHRTWRRAGEQAPFVRLIDADPQVPIGATQLHDDAKQRSDRYQPDRRQDVVRGIPRNLEGCLLDVEDTFKNEKDAAKYEFQVYYRQYFERFGRPRNTSSSDWKMCHILAMRGYSSNAIKAVLRTQSPDEFHKLGGNFEQYVTNMVFKVMRRPEVIARREELAQDREKNREQQQRLEQER